MTHPAQGSLLEFENVDFCYPDGNIGLAACSLGIKRGTRNALIGANGSGKTTLFLHANGLLHPQSGGIRYDGKALDYSREGLRSLRSSVGLVFQNPDQQLFSASVREDVSFGPLNLGLDMGTVRQRVATALRAVNMEGFADRPVHNLSFGQKKRVCIAGVLAMEPELLILDEPMAGLDHAMRVELTAVLDGLQARGITLLLATHDIDFAYRWADQIHVMIAGCCSASLPSAELETRHAALTDAGLPLPTVMTMHRQLVVQDVLPNQAAPRSHAELLDRLATRAEQSGRQEMSCR